MDVQGIKHRIWSNKENENHIYFIVDTAADEIIYGKILSFESECYCIYEHTAARELENVVPYLIKLSFDDHPFTDWVVENGWGKYWGIFIESDASMDELAYHFKTISVVADEQGNQMYFRYYDPRVLSIYLPTCNEDELNIVFGPVRRFIVENPKKADDILEYSLYGKTNISISDSFLHDEDVALIISHL